jgi:primase-polymerase (primpol)-like protein
VTEHNHSNTFSAHRALIPDGLAELDRWAVWRIERDRNGKDQKVPYRVNGGRASSVEPKHWGQVESAIRAYTTGRYNGLSFAFFKEDGLVGVDLDDCLTSECEVKPWAQNAVERFCDTYVEISPSGSGLKAWVRGSLPANLPGVKVGDGAVELYDHGRYFTFTGRAFRKSPMEIADHHLDVARTYEQLHARATAGRKNDWLMQPLDDGKIPYGQQHNTLVSFAGTMRVRGMCERAIEAALQIVNSEQCEKPAEPQHITRIVTSSRRWRKA